MTRKFSTAWSHVKNGYLQKGTTSVWQPAGTAAARQSLAPQSHKTVTTCQSTSKFIALAKGNKSFNGLFKTSRPRGANTIDISPHMRKFGHTKSRAQLVVGAVNRADTSSWHRRGEDIC
mmetsp:Transcript_59218/g.157635  ORF Transcript_59218/g.157635 Transcript_59218/m.157635 type:complete len:119 (-) Transcript_59218:1043-1399(-)